MYVYLWFMCNIALYYLLMQIVSVILGHFVVVFNVCHYLFLPLFTFMSLSCVSTLLGIAT